MNRFDASRRRFAGQLLASAGTLALALGKGREARAAQDKVAAEPRYLVNVHTRGGNDTFWWHSYMKPDVLGATLGAEAIPKYYTQRFNPNLAIPFSGHFLGIGMTIFRPEDLARMALVKGMEPAGSHDVGNRIINCGTLSNYAASFSSLTSVELARVLLPLPLQFVQVSGTAEELYSWPGLLNGYAIAVNIPNLATFKSLTDILPNEVNSTRRAQLSSSLKTLTEATLRSKFRLAQSREYYGSFLASFQGMNAIYGRWKDEIEPEFTRLLAEYQAAVRQAFVRLQAFPFNCLDTGCKNNPDYLEVPEEALEQASFAFALADYLITHGLSRVVDVGPVGCFDDAHGFNAREFNRCVVKYSLVQKLLARLGSIQCREKPGASYLDQTTIAMSTEFDRTPAFASNGVTTNPWGTNHGGSSSLLLFGRNVRGGTVAGDIKSLPENYGLHKASDFAQALPFNPDTGVVDSSPEQLEKATRRMITTQSVFPTVMAAMGVAVPEQQLTEGVPIKAVLKAG